MTVGELKDYLSQFPDSTLVLLHADAADTLPEGTPHIALDVLDYSKEG